MLHVASLNEYRKVKDEASSRGCGLVTHFSAGWCEPCKAVNEFLSEKQVGLADLAMFIEVSCDTCSDIAEIEGVDSVPYVSFYRPGASDNGRHEMECVASVAGAKLDKLAMNLLSIYGEKGSQRANFGTLDEYLKYLTSRKGVILFITGSPSQPRCGFTGRLIEMMNDLQVSYLFYDVMASDEVCEGLKAYAKWPTYPQVYVDGELIGGYDICKQLLEEGELRSTLGMAD